MEAEMKEILIVGDSLTWGHDPASGLRHPPGQRWPVVLAEGLAGRALVTADGLGGRTTCFDDHAGPADRNAARCLPGLLASHQPLDLVVLMLGTNDLKPHVCGLASGAAAGMRRLVEIVRCFPFKGPRRPAVLVIAPPPVVRAGWRPGRSAPDRGKPAACAPVSASGGGVRRLLPGCRRALPGVAAGRRPSGRGTDHGPGSGGAAGRRADPGAWGGAAGSPPGSWGSLVIRQSSPSIYYN